VAARRRSDRPELVHHALAGHRPHPPVRRRRDRLDDVRHGAAHPPGWARARTPRPAGRVRGGRSRAVQPAGHRDGTVRHGGTVKRIPPALAAMLVAGIWLSLAATTAFAHASLESSDPSNGELLETAPDRISLTFTEPPDLSLTTIGVLDDTGAPVPTGAPELAPDSEREVRVRLDPVPDGVYTVTWRTVSATDGHVTASAFSFGVGVSPEAVKPVTGSSGETEPPSATAVAGHWLLYLGLVV